MLCSSIPLGAVQVSGFLLFLQPTASLRSSLISWIYQPLRLPLATRRRSSPSCRCSMSSLRTRHLLKVGKPDPYIRGKNGQANTLRTRRFGSGLRIPTALLGYILVLLPRRDSDKIFPPGLSHCSLMNNDKYCTRPEPPRNSSAASS